MNLVLSTLLGLLTTLSAPPADGELYFPWPAGPVAAAASQDPAPPEEEAAPVTPVDAPPPILREKAYYVPFEKIDEIFEQAGRGIFLPYDEFIELWKKAQPGDPTPVDPEPPAGAVLTGGRYTGEASDELVRFQVTFILEALKKGWSEVRLPFRDVAVESVDVSDPRALFVTHGDGGYSVFLPEPGKYTLGLAFSAPVVQAPGKKSFRFGLPPTAVSSLEVAIPEEDVRVQVEPNVAVAQTTSGAGKTEVQVFLGNSSHVAVSWTPPPGKTTDGAILFARQFIRTHLGERILKISTEIDYEVLRGEVDSLKVIPPENTRVLRVQGENIREWTPDGEALSVELHSPIEKTYHLELSFERILTETPTTLSIPFPRVDGVLRESGWAVLGYDEGLLVRTTTAQGLSQLDPEEVPEALRSHLGVGFRYLAHPLSLSLSIEKITPVVRNSSVSVIALGREEDQWFGWIDYSITKAGLFRLEFRVPSGWSVDSVGDPNTVEEFQTTDADGKRTVTVSLRSKAIGDFKLPFRLLREGSARPGEVVLSPPEVLGSSRDRGLFGVASPRAIEIVTLARQNVIDADVAELLRMGIMNQLPSDAAMPRTFRYRETPASVRLELQEKKTVIDVLAQHLIEVGDGEVRMTHLLDYTVLYAPVTELRFTAPSTLDESLLVEVKQKRQVERQPDGQGMTTWTVSFQPPVLGPVTVTLIHSSELRGLESGQPFRQAIPLIQPRDVRTKQGFAAVRKEGTLEIVPEPDAMEALDTSDLPDKLRRGQISNAFRYFGDAPALALNLIRYDYQELATTVVQFLHQKGILDRERKLKMLATLMVENTERQHLELELPETAIIYGVYVNGSKTSPKKKSDEPGVHLIPIPRSSDVQGGIIPVVISYELPVASSAMGSFGRVSLDTISIRGAIPVSRTELELYVPKDFTYMGWGGNLYPQSRSRPGLWERFKRWIGVAGDVAQANSDPRPRSFVATPAVIPELVTVDLERHDFMTMAPAGHLRFVYLGRNLYYLIDFVLFVAAAVGTVVLLGRFADQKLHVGLLVIFVATLLTFFSTGPVVGFFSSVLLGSAIVCAFMIARHGQERWSSYRSRRLALAPDPFLEEASPRMTPPPPNADTPEPTPRTPEATKEKTEVESPPEASDRKKAVKKKAKKKSTRRGS